MSKVKIPNFKLNNGLQIPALGYGTWLGLNSNYELQMEDAPKMVDAMRYAIDVGYRHFDTAHLYRMEPEIGQVVREKIAQGVVKREDIFITTKVWQHNHRTEDAEASVRASLKRLGLDYVDLVLVHWPMAISEEGIDEKIDYLDTYRGIEAAYDKGLAKSIGVSNFNLDQMKRLLANCRIKPAVNQIEVNLTLFQNELISYCQSNDILIVSYSSYGSMMSKATDNAPPPRIDSPELLSMARKYGKTVPQIVLRFLYQKGVATIPKSLSKNRIVENASIFDFTIDATDIAILEKYNCGYRTETPIFWQHYTNYPFDIVKDAPKMEIPLSLRKWKNGANLDID